MGQSNFTLFPSTLIHTRANVGDRKLKLLSIMLHSKFKSNEPSNSYHMLMHDQQMIDTSQHEAYLN